MSEFAFIPIGPILEYYGFDAIEDGWVWHEVRCAFHGEKNPSAAVTTTEDEQVFNCHACGMKGNAAQIIMKKEGVSYKDAVKRAEGILGGSSGTLHGFRGTGSSLPSDKRDRQSYSEFKRTWLRS